MECACGCGNVLTIKSNRNLNRKFLIGHNLITKRGPNHPSWKGGRCFSSHGYVLIWCPSNIRANNDGYVYEHLLQIQKKIHRDLKKNELVHHINGIKDMNVLWNLQVVTAKEHRKFHQRKGRKDLSDRYIEEFQTLWKWLYGRSQSQQDYYNKLKIIKQQRNQLGRFWLS